MQNSKNIGQDDIEQIVNQPKVNQPKVNQSKT
jgi:hypothetical protein